MISHGKSAKQILFVATLLLTLPLTAQTPPEAPSADPTPEAPPASSTHEAGPGGIELLHDVVFGKGGTQDLHAEIAYPKKTGPPLPAVLWVHGGGWDHGDQKKSLINSLAQAGYFGMSIEYRLSGVAKWPAQIQDCKLAVRWLRANAAKYNVDPNRIGAWGGSAGGQLVACLGTTTAVKEFEGDGGYPDVSSSVQAVVDFFGPVDFTHTSDYHPTTIKVFEKLFGVTYEKDPDLWKNASPLSYVKAGLPPFFIAHGDSDVTVPISQSIAFDAALTSAGVPHQFLIVKNAGHDFKPNPDTTIDPSSADIRKAALAFFDKYLKNVSPN
jgi:acetyl esterase/lipase